MDTDQLFQDLLETLDEYQEKKKERIQKAMNELIEQKEALEIFNQKGEMAQCSVYTDCETRSQERSTSD